MALIKCPECGREISSRAHSCPHCGAVNSARITETQSTSTAPPLEAKQKTVKENRPVNRKRRRLIWIAAAVGAVILVGGGWLLYHLHQQEAEEEARYNELMDNFSIADAETFLLRYPDTQHSKEIKDNITLYQRYESEWATIERSDNPDDFANFRRKFPNSPFDQKAYDKIDSLDWVSASRRLSEAAMQNYLDLHPDGKYADMARQKKQEIIDSRPTEEERSTIGATLRKYFAALSSNNKEDLSNITTPAVFTKSCDFIDSHGSGASYAMVSDINLEKKPNYSATDLSYSGFTYNASCTVNKTAYNAEGTSETKTYNVRATLNSRMQLSAINMRLADAE